MRVLVVLILAAIIIYLVRGFVDRRQASRSSTPPPASSTSRGSEPMRQCLHCGAYFPVSEAVVEAADQVFCSEEHRRLHLQNKA